MTEALEWFGCVTGVIGALIIAVNKPWSRWGFILFLFSNAAWLAQGLLVKSGGMIVMQVAYAVVNAIGVWRWIIVPYTSSKGINRD